MRQIYQKRLVGKAYKPTLAYRLIFLYHTIWHDIKKSGPKLH